MYLLIEKDLTVLSACLNFLANPPNTERIRFWTLKESTISSNDIIHSILCSSVELCMVSANSHLSQNQANFVPSEANTMGLSGLEGSVKQKTSASPSDASRKREGRVPVILLCIDKLTVWI